MDKDNSNNCNWHEFCSAARRASHHPSKAPSSIYDNDSNQKKRIRKCTEACYNDNNNNDDNNDNDNNNNNDTNDNDDNDNSSNNNNIET